MDPRTEIYGFRHAYGILKVLIEYEGRLKNNTKVSTRELDIGDRCLLVFFD